MPNRSLMNRVRIRWCKIYEGSGWCHHRSSNNIDAWCSLLTSEFPTQSEATISRVERTSSLMRQPMRTNVPQAVGMLHKCTSKDSMSCRHQLAATTNHCAQQNSRDGCPSKLALYPITMHYSLIPLQGANANNDLQ